MTYQFAWLAWLYQNRWTFSELHGVCMSKYHPKAGGFGKKKPAQNGTPNFGSQWGKGREIRRCFQFPSGDLFPPTKKLLVRFRWWWNFLSKNASQHLQGRREAFRIGGPANKQILGVYSWIVNHVVSFLRIRPKKGIEGWGHFFRICSQMGMEIANYCSHSIRSFKWFWDPVLFVIRSRVLQEHIIYTYIIVNIMVVFFV